jgi:hypothetical protein
MIYIIDNGAGYSANALYFVKSEEDKETINTIINVIFSKSLLYEKARIIGTADKINWAEKIETMTLDQFISDYSYLITCYEKEEQEKLLGSLDEKIRNIITKNI